MRTFRSLRPWQPSRQVDPGIQEVHHDAFTKELWAFHEAEKLSPTAKKAFVSHIIDAAAQHGDKWRVFQG
jgi:hypothetical protein